MDVAVRQPWVTDLQPIPATLIDKGILKNVPYKSFRSGDYEINIYGDPDQPACLEIGIYGESLKSGRAKANCIEYMTQTLSNPLDRETTRTLKLTKDSKVRDGLTFEISPETDADAYGGWWVTVYNEKALDKARASDKELQEITIPKEEIRRADPKTSDAELDWQRNQLQYARPSSATSRPKTAPPTPVASIPVVSTDRVYVRGYYRKDGTYVRPHTRSRPSR